MTPPASDSPSVLDELRRRLREARASKDRSMFVVAGSGVSIQATGRAPAASWTGLLGLGIERCKQQASGWKKRRFDAAAVEVKLATRRVSDCIAAASVIESTLRGAGGSVYSRWLEETVGELRPTEPEILHALGALGIPVATTNYDGLLEYELGLQPMTWRTHGLVDQLMTGTFPGGGVLHLHGYFNEPQSVVLGASSYDKVLEDKRAQDTLRNLLRNRDLIFVGMGGGLSDPNFGALLEWAKDVTLPDSRYHFLLVREDDARELRLKLSLTLRIHVLVYGREHAELAPFLRGLIEPAMNGTMPQLSPGPSSPQLLSSSRQQAVVQSESPVSAVDLAATPRSAPSVDARPIPTGELRKLLSQLLRTDSDFNAFCLDYFPQTQRLFATGMDRQAKTSLLLEREDHAAVLRRIRGERPQDQQTSQVIWRALLRLDRDTQWGELLRSLDDAQHLNQLVLVHGNKDQNLRLFVRRIEEHLRDKASSLVVEVPLKLAAAVAETGVKWGLHLQQILRDKIGAEQETPAELLALATAEVPLVIVLVALDNPLLLLSTLTPVQLQGLTDFLTKVLPATLAACRRVTVLLPLEYGDEAQSMLPWAREVARIHWHNPPLTSIELARLTLPTYADVEKYLRLYPEPLRDLPGLLRTAKELCDELCRPGTTFERLASDIDNAILLHG